MNITIEIAKERGDWDSVKSVNSDMMASILQNIMNRYDNFRVVKEIEVSILFTDNEGITSLNAEFRNVKKPTNVLSFPDLDINWRQLLEFKPNPDYMYLGDIAFGYEKIKQEAEEKSIKFVDHFKHLFIHAILHLIGYDHNDDEEAEIMESLEVEILKDYNIASPY